jgi:hypothetical protein
MSFGAPKDKFLRFYPGGFSDPLYRRNERDYEWAAHEAWHELLNEPEFDRLLTAEDYQEVCRRALRVESKTNLLALFEKAALHDAVQAEKSARVFAYGLYDLVYGEDECEKRFEEFAKDLASLPAKQASPVKWTIMTIFPFLAHPSDHLFLKPNVTKAAAKRRRFSLNYRPELNWMTYSCLLRFAEALREELADLNPRDMIDIQSYVWVTEFVGPIG